MEYLMPAAFLAVAFFLGAFITNYFKSKKINVLTLEAQEAQSRFYELQSLTKKQLGEREVVIKKLQIEKSKNIDALASRERSPTISTKEVKALKARNSSLEHEIKSMQTRIKELKVEKAVNKVDKKYPTQLYGMDGDKSLAISKVGSIEEQTKSSLNQPKSKIDKADKLKKKKSKVRIILDDNEANTKTRKNKVSSKVSKKKNSKKSKKKDKSKKGRSKKVLALFVSDKKHKKGKRSSKKKKNKK